MCQLTCALLLLLLLRRSGWCSYTCTPDGVRELASVTGIMDRWAEAVIENTYGRVSLLPEPVVLPTLYMPKSVAAGLNAFTYSASLVQQHLQSLGLDMNRDFHTVLVSCSWGSAGWSRCWMMCVRQACADAPSAAARL